MREAEERSPCDINLSLYGLVQDDDSDESSSDGMPEPVENIKVIDPMENIFKIKNDSKARRSTAKFGGSKRKSLKKKSKDTPISKASTDAGFV